MQESAGRGTSAPVSQFSATCISCTCCKQTQVLGTTSEKLRKNLSPWLENIPKAFTVSLTSTLEKYLRRGGMLNSAKSLIRKIPPSTFIIAICFLQHKLFFSNITNEYKHKSNKHFHCACPCQI